MKIKGRNGKKVRNAILFFPSILVTLLILVLLIVGSRRSRNRGRGQLMVKSSKPTTLQFESDFDFETANAQFNKNELVKEASGELKKSCLYLSRCLHLHWSSQQMKCLLLQMGRRRWNRVWRSRRSRTRLRGVHLRTSATTRQSASLTTCPQTSNPGNHAACEISVCIGHLIRYKMFDVSPPHLV